MLCAWDQFLQILPVWMRREIDEKGKDRLLELRMRMGKPAELVLRDGIQYLENEIDADDLHFCVNTASKYSPWTSFGAAYGYITAPGGHRIGICGEAVMNANAFSGIREIQSLCIRIARDFPGIGKDANPGTRNMLVLGAPGWGKTTLLRDIARIISDQKQVCVLDERKELFPNGIRRGRHMDVLCGCTKESGVEILLRTMGPECIVMDEITAEIDCSAILRAYGCGVQLLASAHASSLEDFCRRPMYQRLWENQIFDQIAVLRKDRTYYLTEALAT